MPLSHYFDDHGLLHALQKRHSDWAPGGPAPGGYGRGRFGGRRGRFDPHGGPPRDMFGGDRPLRGSFSGRGPGPTGRREAGGVAELSCHARAAGINAACGLQCCTRQRCLAAVVPTWPWHMCRDTHSAAVRTHTCIHRALGRTHTVCLCCGGVCRHGAPRQWRLGQAAATHGEPKAAADSPAYTSSCMLPTPLPAHATVLMRLAVWPVSIAVPSVTPPVQLQQAHASMWVVQPMPDCVRLLRPAGS